MQTCCHWLYYLFIEALSSSSTYDGDLSHQNVQRTVARTVWDSFKLESIFRWKKKRTVKKRKGAANARLAHLRPKHLGTLSSFAFSNIYPLPGHHAAWDGKEDGVLLGPGSASVHIRAPGQTEKTNQTDGHIQMWETHTMILTEARCSLLEEQDGGFSSFSADRAGSLRSGLERGWGWGCRVGGGMGLPDWLLSRLTLPCRGF